MMVYKCDICKRQIKDRNNLMRISKPGYFSDFEICVDCGKPVIAFLKNKGLSDKDELSVKKSKK